VGLNKRNKEKQNENSSREYVNENEWEKKTNRKRVSKSDYYVTEIGEYQGQKRDFTATSKTFQVERSTFN